MLHHKTFHSYTVRAKQGGSQSNKDNKSGGGSHCKSAGASLRRYNEAAFAEVKLLRCSLVELYTAIVLSFL